jgi:hypothetical protein
VFNRLVTEGRIIKRTSDAHSSCVRSIVYVTNSAAVFVTGPIERRNINRFCGNTHTHTHIYVCICVCVIIYRNAC